MSGGVRYASCFAFSTIILAFVILLLISEANECFFTKKFVFMRTTKLSILMNCFNAVTTLKTVL